MDDDRGRLVREQIGRLEIDHDLLKIGINHCERLVKSPDSGLGRVKSLAHDICRRLVSHMEAEERFFHEMLADESFRSTLFMTMSHDSHKQIRKIVRLVESFPWQPDPQKARTVLDVLVRLVRQHTDHAEKQVFPYIAELNKIHLREERTNLAA